MMRLICILFLASIPAFAQHQKPQIEKFIDAWHLAATNADATAFFGAMDDDCIYIGTDASERWTKAEFLKFAKPYFDKGKAWDFKAYDRDIHVSADGRYVWFSELLTTWMGVCRGSGVLYQTPQGWKLKQYHLSVTVPNDVIKDFISLVENFNQKKK
ncbi:MAG TPA: nuclear transport factor 2 family protein [Chryseosolibacter sp.]